MNAGNNAGRTSFSTWLILVKLCMFDGMDRHDIIDSILYIYVAYGNYRHILRRVKTSHVKKNLLHTRSPS